MQRYNIRIEFASIRLFDAKTCQLRLDLAQCAFLRRESFRVLFGKCFRRVCGTGKRVFQFGRRLANNLLRLRTLQPSCNCCCYNNVTRPAIVGAAEFGLPRA